ncbi:uncharacterized protein LOC117595801 [Pangasianodon hypophthalmus]|uniref:uncharacterized protein LOC117595801 n=1 Tax=Pangasianodon hypophthalmus TaxID=310915 RepID=UPI0014813A65|nr:uncharacterized protein LOC117595801 [Pangasianodon hypophthalmus]
MLPIILIMSILCQGHAVDYGTDFVTAFPENLAYYFPVELSLKLKITTFLPTTDVTIIMNGVIINRMIPDIPQVFDVNIPGAEVNQLGVSNNSIRIISDKKITVLSINKRGDSIQTNVVPPTTRLGVEYLVPSPNYTKLAVQLNTYNPSNFIDSTTVPMDFSYRLIIINAEAVENSVTVTQKLPDGDEVTTMKLDPFALTQLPSSSFWFKVSSTAKVAVILTNPCMDTQNCRCNMVAHQLRPTDFLGTEFIFPPINTTVKHLFVTSAKRVDLSSGSETKTVEPGSIGMLPFLPGLDTGNPSLTTSQPASLRVIQPGLIIDLLPKTMFSGCYLVHRTTQTQSLALVIVATGQKNDVRMGPDPLSGVTWNDISNAEYSWALIDLDRCKSCVIWHPTSQIAVYVFETSLTGVRYGGPAISVNDIPDPNGCVVVPIEFELVNITLSWQASRAQCISKGMVLASPNINYTQNKMVAALNNMNAEGVAWLGLRRSLVSSEWYWHSKVDFNFANWDNNQPASGLCVSMRMEPDGNFTWSSVRCCSPMLPLCAREMVIMGTINDLSTYLL